MAEYGTGTGIHHGCLVTADGNDDELALMSRMTHPVTSCRPGACIISKPMSAARSHPCNGLTLDLAVTLVGDCYNSGTVRWAARRARLPAARPAV